VPGRQALFEDSLSGLSISNFESENKARYAAATEACFPARFE
jgi:hypothetical protein